MLKILGDGDGQMCNKLLFQAQVLASSNKRGFDVVYYGFKRYDGIEYDETVFQKHFISKPEIFILQNALKYILRISKKVRKVNFSNAWYIERKKEALKIEEKIKAGYLQNRTVYWVGWPYMDYESLRSSTNELRQFFSFKQDILKEADAFIDIHQYDVIFGIHMRRGDYKNWKGGKYYYDDATYRRVICEACAQNKGKKIAVILFCNELLHEDSWKLNGVDVFISKNSAVVDLCLLSKCSIIIGPPSSFSGWASFIGNTRRFLLDAPDKSFRENESYVWLTETDGWGIKL